MARRITVLALVGLLVCVFNASATIVAFDDFSSTAGLTLNGSATTTVTSDGTVLRLTPAVGSQAGSAFSSVTINAATFSSFFEFRITDPGGTLFDGNTETGADGLVFVAQSVSSSIGGIGQGIGYEGINHSVGVEFDTWHNSVYNDPNSNHLGVDANGNMVSLTTVNVATRFDDGNIWCAWIDYDGTTLEVRANQTGVRPAAALLSQNVDVMSILGQSTAYVGFTSGTGADWGNHDIISWEYRDSFDPIGDNIIPEPASLVLVGLGVGTVVLKRLRAKR
jgi:hypothetical protein